MSKTANHNLVSLQGPEFPVTGGGSCSPDSKETPLIYAIDALQREIMFRHGKDLGAGIVKAEVESFQQAIEILKTHCNEEILIHP